MKALRILIGLWALGLSLGCSATGGEIAEPAPVAAASSTIQDTLSTATAESEAEERDEIFSLLAYAVVLKDWQTKDTATPRGHNIGAVLVDGQNRIVNWGRNCNKITGNGTQHGEVRLMTGYLNKKRSYNLKTHTVYTSLEPCAQCSGMMIQQSIERTVYGQTDPAFGKAMERLDYDSLPAGYGPYPRPVISDLSTSPIAAAIDAAYANTKVGGGLTQWLLSEEAHELYEVAQERLLSYPLRFEDNAPVLQAAQQYLEHEVSSEYTPIRPESSGVK